jgi:hypothetical protein
MAAKLTRMSQKKKAIQLHLVAESCTIYSSRFRQPVRKLLDTPSHRTLERARDSDFSCLTTNKHVKGSASGLIAINSTNSCAKCVHSHFERASPPCPDQTGFGVHQPPINGHGGLFPWGESGQGVKLTTHFHLVPRSRIRGAILPLSSASWRGA